MAVIFFDGFDGCIGGPSGDTRWAITHGDWTVDASAGRYATAGYVPTTSTSRATWTPGAPINAIVFGFAFKLNGRVEAVGYQRLARLLAGSSGPEVGADLDGNLVVRAPDGTVLITLPGSIRQDTWYYVELRATFSSRTLHASLDGGPVVGGIVISTSGFGTACTAVELGGSDDSVTTATYDDVYVIDMSLGTANRDFLGNSRVELIRPDRNGDLHQWTAQGARDNYQTVDESLEDGDETYVTTNLIGLHELYGCSVMETDAARLAAVQVVLVAKQGVGGVMLQTSVHSGGTTYNSPNVLGPGASYAEYRDIWDQAPGSVPWTDDALAAAQLGYMLTN